ncbi:MAG TPA: hypothetical protein DCG53_13570 [Syntrophus sp. (in: bacteria)]|jgi:hypothetical protein|nr:hypothetical protein [Syntrophus sp. (in: bacteria)]
MKIPDHLQLVQRFQELRNLCLGLAEGLSSLVSDLQKGELRQLEVTEAKIASLRQEYEILKKDVIAFASPYQAIPNPGGITSLATLEPLLLAVNQSLKAAAIQVLDQVSSVKHREETAFEPLRACLSAASELHRAIAQVPLPDLHPEVVAITDGSHPLALFVSLVRDRRHMKEEKIAAIQDVIAGAFGNLLFIAALMGKLIIGEQDGKEAETKAQDVSQPATVKTSEAAITPSESEEVLEQRQILQDLLTMTEMKIQKLLKNRLVREEELAGFVAAMKEMEASRYRKSDFKEDFRQLHTIRAALEEMENKAFNPRKRLERTEGQRR